MEQTENINNNNISDNNNSNNQINELSVNHANYKTFDIIEQLQQLINNGKLTLTYLSHDEFNKHFLNNTELYSIIATYWERFALQFKQITQTDIIAIKNNRAPETEKLTEVLSILYNSAEEVEIAVFIEAFKETTKIVDNIIPNMKNNTEKKEKDISVSTQDSIKKNTSKLKPGLPKRNLLMEELKNSRLTVLDKFQALLQKNRVVVLHGLGGTGKTTFAIQYAYEHEKDYEVIVFVKAENGTTLTESLYHIANILLPKTTVNKKLLDLLETLINYFETNIESKGKKGLVIFDNVQDPGFIANILPTWKSDIIITSRNPDWMPEIVDTVEVGPLEEQEAIRLIGKLLDKNEKEIAYPEFKNIASKLAHTLGYLPLAIVPAVQYCKRYMRLERYIEVFTAENSNYNTQTYISEGAPIDIKRKIDKVLKVSLTKITETAKEALPLLQGASLVNADNIPYNLLNKFLEIFSPEKGKNFELAIKGLEEESLIRVDPYEVGDDNSYDMTLSVHRLIQQIVYEELSTNSTHKDEALRAMLQTLNNLFTYTRQPRTEQKPFPAKPYHPLLATHTESLLEHIKKQPNGAPLETLKLMNSLGIYYYNQDSFSYAIKMFEAAEEIAKEILKVGTPESIPQKVLSTNDVKFLSSPQKEILMIYAKEILHNLYAVRLRGAVQQANKPSKELEESYKFQQLIDPDSVSTLFTLRNIGRIHIANQNFTEASNIIQQLESNNNYIRDVSLKFLVFLDKGNIYRTQADVALKNNDRDKAEKLFNQAIEEYKKGLDCLEKEQHNEQQIDQMLANSFIGLCYEQLGELKQKRVKSSIPITEWEQARDYYYRSKQVHEAYQEDKMHLKKGSLESLYNADMARNYGGLAKMYYKLGQYATAQEYLTTWQKIQEFFLSSNPNYPYIGQSRALQKDIVTELSKIVKLSKEQQKVVNCYLTQIDEKVGMLLGQNKFSPELEQLLLYKELEKRSKKVGLVSPSIEETNKETEKQQVAIINNEKLQQEQEDTARKTLIAMLPLSSKMRKCKKLLTNALVAEIKEYTKTSQGGNSDTDKANFSFRIMGAILNMVDPQKLVNFVTATKNPLEATITAHREVKEAVNIAEIISDFIQARAKEKAEFIIKYLEGDNPIADGLTKLSAEIASNVVIDWLRQIDKLSDEGIKKFADGCAKRILEYIGTDQGLSLSPQKRMMEGLIKGTKGKIDINLTTEYSHTHKDWKLHEMLIGAGIKLYCKAEEAIKTPVYTRQDKRFDHIDKYEYRWGSIDDLNYYSYEQHPNEIEATNKLKKYKLSQHKCQIM